MRARSSSVSLPHCWRSLPFAFIQWPSIWSQFITRSPGFITEQSLPRFQGGNAGLWQPVPADPRPEKAPEWNTRASKTIMAGRWSGHDASWMREVLAQRLPLRASALGVDNVARVLDDVIGDDRVTF